MALALSAAACGSSGGDGAASGDSTDVSGDSADSTEAAAPSSLLDISAPTADGSTIELSDYAGQDLLLWFWAPW